MNQPPGESAAPTVVRQSSAQRDGLFGGLIAIFLLTLWRGYTGATTTDGHIAIVAFVCAVSAAVSYGWVWMIRRGSRLEISEQAITYLDRRLGSRTLTRQSGDTLAIVMSGGRYPQPQLTIPGSGTRLPLPFFSVRHVKQECSARGWRFTSGSR